MLVAMVRLLKRPCAVVTSLGACFRGPFTKQAHALADYIHASNPSRCVSSINPPWLLLLSSS